MQSFWALYDTYRLGDVLNVTGLVITIGGFIATIWIALRSKKAAEQALQAAEAARARIAEVDTLADLTTAITALDEIKTLHRSPNLWVLLPDRYTRVRRALVSSNSPRTGHLSDEDRTIILGAQAQMTTMENNIERVINATGADLDVPRLNRIVRKETDKLQSVAGRLKLKLTELVING